MKAGELKALLKDIPDDSDVRFDTGIGGRTWPVDSFVGIYKVSRGMSPEGWADEAGRKYLESRAVQPPYTFKKLEQLVFVLTDFKVPK